LDARPRATVGRGIEGQRVLVRVAAEAGGARGLDAVGAVRIVAARTAELAIRGTLLHGQAGLARAHRRQADREAHAVAALPELPRLDQVATRTGPIAGFRDPLEARGPVPGIAVTARR